MAPLSQPRSRVQHLIYLESKEKISHSQSETVNFRWFYWYYTTLRPKITLSELSNVHQPRYDWENNALVLQCTLEKPRAALNHCIKAGSSRPEIVVIVITVIIHNFELESCYCCTRCDAIIKHSEQPQVYLHWKVQIIQDDRFFSLFGSIRLSRGQIEFERTKKRENRKRSGQDFNYLQKPNFD